MWGGWGYMGGTLGHCEQGWFPLQSGLLQMCINWQLGRRQAQRLKSQEMAPCSSMSNTPKLSRFIWGILRFNSFRTLRLDSIRTESPLANWLLAWRIDNRGNDSCQFDWIESNWQHFQPTLKSRSTIFSKSRANRLPACRFDYRHVDSTEGEMIRVDSTE